MESTKIEFLFVNELNHPYSIFQYNDQIIKSRNKDIYDQVEVGKKYNARIKILIHNDQTENYDVAEIISGIKK